jgi:hypothetical protein
MAMEALRGKVARRSKPREPEPLPIGELDQDIFNCPVCARPLSVGVHRCPTCGTRLIAGVPLRRAGGFVAVGVIGGLMVAFAIMIGSFAVERAGALITFTLPGTVTPPAAPAATAAPIPTTAPNVVPAVPSSAIAALRQTTLLNQRIMADRVRLAAAVGARKPDGAAIAAALRSLAADASIGKSVVADVADWAEAGAVTAAFVDFYAGVAERADAGLSASVTNDKAYVKSGKSMLKVLAGLPALDAQARALTDSIGIKLPPLVEGAEAP